MLGSRNLTMPKSRDIYLEAMVTVYQLYLLICKYCYFEVMRKYDVSLTGGCLRIILQLGISLRMTVFECTHRCDEAKKIFLHLEVVEDICGDLTQVSVASLPQREVDLLALVSLWGWG